MPKLHLLPQSSKIFKDCIFIVIGVSLIFFSLNQESRIDLVGLVTTSAVLTAVIGLAAQEPLKDLISGVSLQLEQVIQEGDWVEIDNQVGQVTSISWRGTELLCKDGSRLILPNARVSSQNICNYSNPELHRQTIQIELNNNIPPHLVKAIMHKISEHHPLVLSDPAPIARIQAIENQLIRYEWMVWHQSYAEHYQSRGDLQEQLWYALHREGLNRPFPARRVEVASIHNNSKERENEEREKTEFCLRLLKKNGLFSALTDNQLLQIISPSPRLIYCAEEIIVREKESGESLFLIIEGKVLIQKQSTGSKSIDVCELGAGEVFGEMTLFTGTLRSASAKCVTNVEVLEINRKPFAGLMEQEPDLLHRLSSLINKRKANLKDLEEKQNEANEPDTLEHMQRIFFNLINPSNRLRSK